LNDSTLTILADESCDFSFVRTLRAKGFDVKAIAEMMPGASDLQVLELGFKERRVIITEDKDFGEWVFAQKRPTTGVVFLRYPIETRAQISLAIVELMNEHGARLKDRYVVLEPGRARIRRPK
jgi:predicted nuclease of predicted toxin-antitoxin system